MRLSTMWLYALLLVALLSQGTPAPQFVHETSGISIRSYEPASANEGVLQEAQRYLDQHRNWGRVTATDKLSITVVPTAVAWPTTVPRPPAGRGARAAGPWQVVVLKDDLSGLAEAVALAVTQPAGSAAFSVDWLHEGMGTLLADGFNLFPANAVSGEFADLERPGTAMYRKAAVALAGLVMDRWGINWPVHYPRTAGEMAPKAALLWASGRDHEQAALAYWQERRYYLYRSGRRQYQFAEGDWIMTAADMSPVRVSPQLSSLPKGPFPNDNRSPHQYDLNASFDPVRRTVSGEERLTWKNGEGIPVDTLYFNLWPNAEQFAIWGGGMRIDSVSVDGKAAAYTAQALDLTVPLGRPVAPGEVVTVTVRFVTRLPGTITQRDFGAREQRFTLAHWFPSLAVLDDRGWILHALSTRNAETYSESADFHVRLSVPAGTVLGATGNQKARVTEGDRWIYEYDAPSVKDWVATGGTDLKEAFRTIEGVSVQFLSDDDTWLEGTPLLIERAMRYYNAKFGAYPYKTLVVSSAAPGMEWPAFMFTEPWPGNDDVKRYRYLYVTYHEFAHQWFYGIVGNDQYHEPWLDEGFTAYADRSAFRAEGIPPYGGDIPSRKDLEPVHVTASQHELAKFGTMRAMYYKGARVLEDLEALVGTETMDRLMKEWVRRYTHRTATSAEFVALATEITGRNLTGFFTAHEVFPADRSPYRPVLPLGQAVP